MLRDCGLALIRNLRGGRLSTMVCDNSSTSFHGAIHRRQTTSAVTRKTAASRQSANQPMKCSAFPDAIAETPHSFNGPGGFAEFFTHPAHVRIHRASIDQTFVTPNFIQQAITG